MRRMNEIEEAALKIKRHCESQSRCAACCLYNHNDNFCMCDETSPDTWKLSVEEKAFEQTDVCPHCDNEITLTWDVDNDGYRVFCPNCGEELMLCDACLHADNNPGGKCDFEMDFDGNPTCFRRREHNDKTNN